MLELFDGAGVRGTFFVLGWVAERFPQLVRRIAAAGHELASHGYWHRLVYEITPAAFREDLIRSRAAIEQATGVAVTAYRAPSFSIGHRSLWALDILAESGFTVDSSIFPIRHDRYGMPAHDSNRTASRPRRARSLSFLHRSGNSAGSTCRSLAAVIFASTR